MNNIFSDKRKLFGTILGLIMFVITVVSITYAYYSWRSGNTTVTFNIQDNIFFCETNINSSVSSLSPTTDYKNGTYQTFIVKNIGRQDTTFSLTMNVTNISSDVIKDESFKYKLMLDPTGGSKNCASSSVNDCTLVGEGNFSNIQVGMNTLIQSITLPNNSKYQYYFFMYLDGNMSNPTGIQGASMTSALGVCDIYAKLDVNTTCPVTVSSNCLKLTADSTYGAAASCSSPNGSAVGLPTPSRSNTEIKYDANATANESFRWKATSGASWTTATYSTSDPTAVPIKQTITYTSSWNTRADGAGSTITNNTNVTTTENQTLFAKWTPNATSVILPYIERDGYTFMGWYTDASGGTKVGNAGSTYTVPITSCSHTLHGRWMENNYYNVNTDTYYETLKDAMNSVANNQTIRVLKGITETEAITLLGGKTGIKLDMNGKTTTLNGISFVNNGSLDIYSSVDGGVLQGNGTSVINNNGTLTTNSYSDTHTLTIRNTTTYYNNYYVIANNSNKNLTLNDNTTITYNNSSSGTRYLINNQGIFNMNGATLTNTISTTASRDRGINCSSSTSRVRVNSGTINTGGVAIYNTNGVGTESDPAILVAGGSITSAGYGVYNSGFLNITGGSITSSGSYGIYNTSSNKVTVTGGSVQGTNGIYNTASGIVDINGSNVTVNGTNGYGVRVASGTFTISDGTVTGSTSGVYITTGTATVSGGSVNGTSQYGAYVYGAGTLTVNSGSVSGKTYGAYNYVAGSTVTITGGTITGNTGIYNKAAGVINVSGSANVVGISGSGTYPGAGELNISSGTITGSTLGAYLTSGTINMTGGTITGNTYGVNATTGTINITSGTITGNTNHGVYISSNGTLTMGSEDLPVSNSEPVIICNGTANNLYGVYLNTVSNFNFYDGIVKSKRIDGSINRDNSSITRPNGYYVVKERGSSTEDAYLSNQAYTLTFNSNGGNATVTNGTGSVSVVVNSHSIYPSTITLPTRTATVSYDMGSTGIAQISSSSVDTPLAGWYSQTSGDGLLLTNAPTPVLKYLSGYTDTYTNWVRTSNTTVHAHWSNGSVTLPALSQVGHSCKWHRGSASGTAYNPGTKVTDISANTTFVAVCPPISYEITINSDCGVNNLAATGWTGSPATTIKKSFDYGSTINLASVVTPSFKNGYSGISYTKSSGAGELNGTTFTVGAGIATITAKATALAAPTCSISGGATKIYNYQDTQLTATNSTSFDSGVTLSYQFGHAGDNNTAFANFENGNVSGSPNKYNVTKALYRGTRYYGTKITATGCNSLSNSCTTATGSGTVMTLKNKKITFNATANGGTLSGTETLYIAYNDANVYTAATNTTTGTIPTASKAGYTFAGWYTTQTTGGVKVINGNGTLVSSATDGSTVWISGSKWANISLSDATLYARFIINSYTVSYASNTACPLPSGSSSTGYDSATVQFGDVINKANPTCTGYDFDGWTLTGGDTSTAKYGTTNNPTTAWVNKNKGTYFKGLASTTGATPTMTANWKAKCYTVTVKAGAGISSLARTGWTGTGTGTLTKELCYGTTDDLSGFTPTYKNGYSGRNNVITSGAGSISGNTFTVGDGVTTITVNATAIETPSCTVGIASTSKIYGASTTALSGSVSNTYDSSISVSYTYYYDTSASGSYANTQSSPISATNHKGIIYYKAKCVATGEGSLSSNAMSSNHVSLTLNPTKYTLNANSCGTFQGGGTTSDYYVYKGETTLYSNTTGTTTTWPTFNVLSYKDLNGWYTLSSNGNKVLNDNGTISGAVSGYTTDSAYDSTASDGTKIYAQCTNKTFSTTIHYNSNATSGSFTAATVGLSCVAGDDGTCTVTIPSTVTSSKGKYNSTYAGLANVVSRMNTDIAGNATTITLSASSPSDYYAKYSTPLTIYYPNASGGVSSSNNVLYRNEYFSSATAMTTISSTGATSNLQAITITLSNSKGTFYFLSTTVYNGIGNFSSFGVNHSNVINSNLTTYYAITTESADVSCAYNSNTASGSFTKATANATVRKWYYCASTSEVYTSNSFSVPSSISNSVGKYNSAYAGLTTTTNGTISTPNTESTACYAYYSSPLTIYYPNTSGGVSSSNTALYRNEYINDTNDMTTLTSIADIGANYKVQATNSNVSLPNLKGTFAGITPTANTSTGYMAVNNSGVINSNNTIYYAVTSVPDDNATIYYNSNTTAGGFTPSTATVTGTSTYYCVNTSTQDNNGSTISLNNVPATVRNSVGKWNTPYHGISSAVNSMTLASSMTTGGSYYAVYGAGETTGGTGAVDSNVDEYYSDNNSSGSGYIYSRSYDYTGNIQTFSDPIGGYYKLETWGAQGGNAGTYNGGKGGYSSGIVHLNANETLYVVVGGIGSNMVSGQIATGGYNGGGNGATDSYGSSFGGAGGGATHIAKSTGLLSSLSSNQSSVLIVAGAGGGANLRGEGYGEGSGGVGGGLNGDNGLSTNHTNGWGYGYGTGGTQTDAGVKVIVGGTGISSSIDYESGGGFGFGGTDQSGGGAGYYGGGGGGHGGAGGGSGYIGTLKNGVTIAGDSSMPSYNGSNTVTGNSGNGFARITKIGKNDIYRNEFFTSKTAMNTVLSASALGTTNITTSSGAGNSPWYGYSTSGNTTRAYNNVGSAANSTSIDLYSIYQMQIFYQKGTNVSEIGATTGNCLMSYSDYSCNSVTPSITPATGYDENGWSATLDDTNYGVAPNTSVPFSISNQTYYGNATPLSVDVTYNSGNYIDYIPDMNDWSYLKRSQFNVTYDNSTNMNSVTVTGVDGWEQIYLPFSVISGKKYHVSFSYSIPSAYTAPFTQYPGLAVQILNALPTDSDNSSSIVTPNHYLPTAVTDESVMNFEFTSATTGTYYLVFNFGMVSDGSTTTFNLGDFNISYDIAVQHAHYGDNYQVPSPDPTRSGYGLKNNDKWHDEYDHLVNNETTITIPVNHSVIAQWQKNPIITYSSGNIITGMDNIGTTQGESGATGVHYMEYSITNGEVTVHNIRGAADGFGFTNGRVYLEANHTYRFNADVDGTWSTTENSGQVEAYLLLNGLMVSGVNVCRRRTFCHMDSNSNFVFTPLISGEYWLRLDVNESGGTYTFSNIRVEEIIDRITVPYGGNYILPTSNPTRNENQFIGWYTEENGGGTQVTSSIPLVQDTDHTVYANWNKMYHVFLQSQTTDNIWDAYYNEYNGHSNDVTTWGIQPSNQTNYTYLYNATWGDDYLKLNGTNSYGRTTIAYGNQVSSSTFTAEATIMIDSYPSDKGVILSNFNRYGVNFYIDKVGRIGFKYLSNNAIGYYTLGPALALNKKYHVAATFNAGVVKLYVNGKLVKQETKSASSILHPPTSDGYIFVTLGCDPNANGCDGSYFNGKIYNFIFHNETTYSDAMIAEDAGLDVVGGNSTYGNLPTPVRSGEDFYGWYDSLDFTNQITSSSLYNKTENTTLYAKWRTDLNTTFYDNEFYAPISITNSTSNGLSYSWDSTKNYLTINGTQSSTGSYINATIPTSLAYGDEWDIVLRHVSGYYSTVNNLWSVFVVDAGNGTSNISDGIGTYNVSTRSFIDCVFPNNGSNTCTYAPNVAAGNEAKNIMIWLYISAANSVTFNNYVVQLDIVKRKTTYYNGTSWNDLAREKNAVVNNGTFTAPSGDNDGYLSLNGTNAWANLGTTTHTNRFTVEADVMLNSVNTSEAYLVSNINSGGYGLKLDSGGKLSACAYIGSSLTCATATTSLSPGVMYKLAGTYNGSNIRAYVNGVEVASVAATGNIGVPTNSTVMAVGANPNGSSAEGSYFNGRVYRIKISNMALPVNRLGQDRIESSTVRYYDVDSVKTHYTTLSEQSGEFYNIPNDVSTSLRGGFDGWRKNTSAYGSVTGNTRVSYNYDHALYANYVGTSVRVVYHLNGGEWAGSTNSTLGTATYVDEGNVSHPGDIVVTHYNGTRNYELYEYGSTVNLYDWNNPNFINISKDGKKGKDGVEWCTQANGGGTCYNQATDYSTNDFCDASSQDCTVNLYVNWVRNFTCGAQGTETTYAGKKWYTISNQNGICNLALNSVSSTVGSYNSSSTNLYNEYFTVGSELRKELDANLITSYDTNSGLTTEGLSGNYIYWNNSGSAYHSYYLDNISLSDVTFLYYAFQVGGPLSSSAVLSYVNNPISPHTWTNLNNDSSTLTTLGSVTTYATAIGSTFYKCFRPVSGSTSNVRLDFDEYSNFGIVSSSHVTAATFYFKACGGSYHNANRFKISKKSSTQFNTYNYSGASSNTRNFSDGWEYCFGGNVAKSGSGTITYNFANDPNCHNYTAYNQSYYSPSIVYRLHISVVT